MTDMGNSGKPIGRVTFPGSLETRIPFMSTDSDELNFPAPLRGDRLSIWTLARVFRWRILVTWTLTILETAMLALFPLLIGRSIDGLLAGELSAFQQLVAAMAVLLVVATGRRLYDTRAYGSMRVALGQAQALRAGDEAVSVTNARVLMGRELVDFLEREAPLSITGVIQVIVALIVLFSFHGVLALSAAAAAAAMLGIYAVTAGRFFRLNADLNQQSEAQVAELESRSLARIGAHLLGLRRHEVRLSDTEAIVYALIFAALLAMLAFNLWFAAARTGATTGEIFAIVTYSYEFIETSVILPMTLQSLTRLSEITDRINKSEAAG